MTGSLKFSTSRRRFITGAGTVIAGTAAGTLVPSWARAAPTVAEPPVVDGAFTLGVASGDPTPDGVVLWTRLAPDPLAGGGMPARAVNVGWQVARDADFHRPVQRGRALARPESGHSVHVEVHGLEPDTEYFYRFRVGRAVSDVGRTRTAPRRGSDAPVRFAFASCQNWQYGYFTPLRHLADEDVACVLFLGDYIYESAPWQSGYVRQHEGTGEPVTVEQYRNRYAQYRTDPDLRRAHAAAPWIVTFDDHELDNNWADDVPQDPDAQSPEAFRARRVAAFQAYYEHMPLRRGAKPFGPDMRLYRGLSYGRTLGVSVLDTRQYRSDQAATLEEAEDPARSITGAEQGHWLTERLTAGSSRWNLVANQVMIAQNDRQVGPAQRFDFDNWDGYRAQGAHRHVRHVRRQPGHRGVPRVLRPDQGGEPALGVHRQPARLPACHAGRDALRADLRVVTTVTQPEAEVSTYASFVVESGKPGVEVDHVAPRPVAELRSRPEIGPAGPLPLDVGHGDTEP